MVERLRRLHDVGKVRRRSAVVRSRTGEAGKRQFGRCVVAVHGVTVVLGRRGDVCVRVVHGVRSSRVLLERRVVARRLPPVLVLLLVLMLRRWWLILPFDKHATLGGESHRVDGMLRRDERRRSPIEGHVTLF